MSWRRDGSARVAIALATAGVLLAVTLSARAEDAWTPAAETQCKLQAWVSDANPRGVEVHAAPSATTQVLGTLPPYLTTTQEGYAFGVPLSIAGSRDGWVRIANARDDSSFTGAPERPTYAGTGWIPATALRFAVQSGRGYVRPDAKSKRIVDLGSDWLTEMGKIDRVLACSGDWALLEFTLHSRRDPATEALKELPSNERNRQRAWFRRICAAQETTCEGLAD